MANEHGYRNVLFEDIASAVALHTAHQLEEYEKEQKALEANPDALGTKKPKSVASVPVVPRNR